MNNPFEEIIEWLRRIEERLPAVPHATTEPTPEIIDREELCKRLGITEPTVIRWEKKGKIPCIRIGSAVRYNWTKVLEVLQNRT